MRSKQPTDDPFMCGDTEMLRGLGGTEHGVAVKNVRQAIEEAGIICSADPRISGILKSLDAVHGDHRRLTKDELFAAVSDNLTLLHRIATNELAIADFPTFTRHLRHLKELVEPNTSGQNADYIPTLRDAPSDKFGVAFCSVDGQFFEDGDSRDSFSIQSTSKPLTFALALEKLGTEKVLEWTGIEPSGRAFNDISFLPDDRPFNPMVNSGALMTAATLASAYPDLAKRDGPNGVDGTYGQELCEEVLMDMWSRLSGNGVVGDIGFSEETFLGERKTADVNRGIAYSMKARKGLPPYISLQTMIDFYLRACSITANTSSMAVVAATLANGGRNPITGDQVFSADVVKKTLSVLSFCGFYNNAGEFFFHTGVPSKSGVSGIVFLVMPNVGGFAIFSPRLNEYGNSVRGSEFAKKLVNLFTFHSFDCFSSLANGCKLDPRFSCDFSRQRNIARLQWALKAGGKRAKLFDNMFIGLCLRIALADGSVEDNEITELKSVYKSVMQADLTTKQLDDILDGIPRETGQAALDEMYQYVKNEERFLDDTEKQLLIEAAVKITVADGAIAAQERDVLKMLARALNIDEVVLELHLQSWEVRLKQNGKAANGHASNGNGIAAK